MRARFPLLPTPPTTCCIASEDIMTSFLNGLSAFPITPADAGGEIDTSALKRLLAPLIAANVDSIGLLGSTGTYPFFSRAERRRATDAALQEINGRIPVLVGIGALRTDEAIALAQDAKAAGASAGLLAAVSYTPLTEAEVFEHFSAVASASGLPICIYDNFGTTHFKFTPELIGRIADIPGVVSGKATAPSDLFSNHLNKMRSVVPSGFSVGYSGDWNATEALIAGGDAWYSVAAGLFPNACLAMTRAAQAGDATEARRLDAAMAPLWALFKELSSLRVMYAAADIKGICKVAPPRPILPLPDAAKVRIAKVLKEMDLG